METESMFEQVASRDAALRLSIEALGEIVSLYDRLGLMLLAVHAATALHAACSALADGSDRALGEAMECTA